MTNLLKLPYKESDETSAKEHSHFLTIRHNK